MYESSEYVIVVRRRISDKRSPAGEDELDIWGPHLQQALSDIHRDTEEVSFDEEPPKVAHSVLKSK